MDEGYVIGIDFGLKHIGVAIGQTITRSARGLKTLSAKNGRPDWKALDELVHPYRPLAITVGLPLNMDGTDSDMSQKADGFAESLRERYAIPVYLVDERLSTWQARTEAQEGGTAPKTHERAASLIAETWMAEQ